MVRENQTNKSQRLRWFAHARMPKIKCKHLQHQKKRTTMPQMVGPGSGQLESDTSHWMGIRCRGPFILEELLSRSQS